MNQSGAPASAARDVNEQVETLLIELSARFIRVAPERVDSEIQNAQRRICEYLGLDRSSLFQQPADDPAAFLLTHMYQRLGMPAPPAGRPDAARVFPWMVAQLREGKTLAISTPDELPAEAARDRESLRRYGTRSVVVVPLSIGSEMLGALSFVSARELGSWPEALVKRLQLVGDVLANAIARAHSDEAQRESEARVKLIADSTGTGLWVLTLETGRIWATRKTRELFDFAPEEELHYERLLSAVHPEDRGVVHQAVQRALQKRADLRVEARIPLPDGGHRWVATRGSCPPDAPGKPKRLMGVSFDVTERKRAEEELRESRERYALAVEGVNDGLWDWDLRTNHAYFSPRWKAMLGYQDHEVADEFSAWESLLHPEDRERAVAALQAHLSGAVPVYELEHRLRHKDGTYRWILTRGKALRGVDGRPYRMAGSHSDITAHKQAQDALRQRNEYIETILEQAPVGFAVHTIDDGVGRFVSARFEEIYGVPRGTVTSFDSFFDKVWPHDPDLREQLRSQAVADIASGDAARMRWENVRVPLPAGEARYITAVNIPLYDQNLMVSTVQDVTDRVRAENDLRRTLHEVQRLRDQLQQQNVYLQQEVKLLHGHTRIVGQSPALKRVLAQVEQVAPTGSTVLLLGETGTGKELIAAALHELSPRQKHTMVRVNCSAIPASLIESELFGREKGAYTGALSRQVGRFELANGSTLFLDEIGDLPPEVQVKLLRVLQEKQIERLGSPKSIAVDVRIIAATNQNLENAVRDGRFRQDLYYRLNVFPIMVPPLRERREDIAPLVSAFVSEFSTAFGKNIVAIARESMNALLRYHWPGNVRELRNVVERAMIVTKGPKLWIEPPGEAAATSTPRLSMEEVDRDHICRVLQMTGWRVRGKNGAAEVLGMKPTTLESRMAKLGIRRAAEERAAR